MGTEHTADADVAAARIRRGLALRGEGRLDDELACYDDVVAQFGYARPAEIVTQVALALLNKGVALGSHRMHERAIVAYNEVVRRFGERSESSLREHVAMAMVNCGWELDALGRKDDAIKTYDEVVARFEDAPEPEVAMQAALAFFNKAHTVGTGAGIAVCDDVLKRYGRRPEPFVGVVITALFNKARANELLGDHGAAIAGYDEVISRVTADMGDERQLLAATALTNLGALFARTGETHRALGSFEAVLGRYSGARDPMIAEQVAQALAARFRLLETRR